MKNRIYIWFAILILTLASCDDQSKGVFTDDTTEEYQLYDYYVDEYGNEGIVAYIFKSTLTESEYIIVVSATESYQSWGLMGETVYKDSIDKMHIYRPTFGLSMLQSMKSAGIEHFPAQAWCDRMNGGEKYPRAGSWRLPTDYEFQDVFGAKGDKVTALNNALRNVGGTPVSTDNIYWTCVEDVDDYIHIADKVLDYDPANRAVPVSPKRSSFDNKDRWLKKNKYYVRAIKYVYYRDDK